MSRPRVAVFSASWARRPRSEIAVATRSIAAAVSRLATVEVFVPGDGAPSADGAFDVTGVAAGGLPGAPAVPYAAVLAESGGGDGRGDGDGGDGALTAAADVAGDGAGVPVFAIGTAGGATRAGARAPDAPGGVLAVDLGDAVLPPGCRVGLYARINPGAAGRRHYGLGSTPDYLLVLGDRTGTATGGWPSGRTRWLLARFPRSYVVVVEGGVARTWRSRSCVARFEVHTRMDLWILMAQAQAVVDLLPGDVYARECVEALRYGVPIAAAVGSGADGLLQAGGALGFSSTTELLSCVEALTDPSTRTAVSSAGKELVDHWYGDPSALVARVAAALGLPVPQGGARATVD